MMQDQMNNVFALVFSIVSIRNADCYLVDLVVGLYKHGYESPVIFNMK